MFDALALIGETESNVVQYLIELEEAGLIETSRGNLNKEDVRISFPHHPRQFRSSESERAQPASSLGKLFKESQPQLFAADSHLAETTEERAATLPQAVLTKQSHAIEWESL